MAVQDPGADGALAKNALRLRAFVRSRVRNDADADDISQEAYARVLARSRGGSLKDPVAYAFRVALNLVSDKGRARARLGESELAEDMASADPSPFEALDMKERAERYARALRAMPRMRREVFVLRQSANLGYPQISDRLGISIEAAQKHFSRAVIDVRRAMDTERAL